MILPGDFRNTGRGGEVRMRQLAEAARNPPPTAKEDVGVDELAAVNEADGFDPAEARRIAESEVRVLGARPRSLHDHYQSPDMVEARRRRIAEGRRADARMGRFEANYNAATGAPGWGFGPDGQPGRVAEQEPERPEAMPMDRALAAEEAAREKTRGQMEEQIVARRKGDGAARAAGFNDQQDRQDRTLEAKTVGGRNILKGQWVDTQAARYGIPPEEFGALYEQFGQGKTHKETIQAIVGSGVLRELRSAKNFPGARPSLADRRAAVQANAKQYNEARKLAGPQGRAFLANSIMGARTPEDLERVMAAAHAVDPRGGWDRMAANKAAALAEVEAPDRGPMQQMAEDFAAIEQLPLGRERANRYRLMYQATLREGQPAQPDQEAAFFVNNGAQGAAEAAAALVTGGQDPEAKAYLQEWTTSFGAMGMAPSRRSYEAWIRKLGLPLSQQSMNLYQELTGVSPRNFWGLETGIPHHPGMGPKPAPNKGRPGPKRGGGNRRPPRDD